MDDDAKKDRSDPSGNGSELHYAVRHLTPEILAARDRDMFERNSLPYDEGTLVLRRLGDGHGGWEDRAFLWCPACEDTHQVGVASSDGRTNWNWNGSRGSPTFSPSIKVEGVQWSAGTAFHKRAHKVRAGEPTICHSHVENGEWKFLSDCTHDLAGQTVPLVPVPTRIDIPGEEL